MWADVPFLKTNTSSCRDRYIDPMPPFVLTQNADIDEFKFLGTGSRKNVLHMMPVHASVDEGTRTRVCTAVAKSDSQKILKVGQRKFARGHDEFAVPLFTLASDVALNRHVIGKIRKDDCCLSIPKQRHVSPGIKRGPADDPVCVQKPKVVESGDGWFRWDFEIVGGVRICCIQSLDQNVTLGLLKASRIDVQVRGD